MGAAARAQVVEAKLAFPDRDVDLADDLARQDREINRLNREIFRMAVDGRRRSEDKREWAMMMTMVARALERIGDNAVDIGEQIDLRRDRAVPRVSGRYAPLRSSQSPIGWHRRPPCEHPVKPCESTGRRRPLNP